MKLEIPEATTTNNRIMRMHYRQRSSEHARWDYLVKQAMNGAKPKAKEHCIVTVTRYGNRLLDWDNCAGGFKFLLDALVHNTLILDDNPNCITRLHMYQRQCKRKEEKTIVEID